MGFEVSERTMTSHNDPDELMQSLDVGQHPMTVETLLKFLNFYVEMGIGDDPVFFAGPGLRDHAVEAIGYESIQGARGVVLREFTSRERIHEDSQSD